MIPQEVMTLAKRAGRPFGAVFFGSLALMASAASCASGEPTLAPGDGASAGKTTSGAGQGHGATTGGGAGTAAGGRVGSGGSVASSGGGAGGVGGSVSVGGTGTAGMNTAGAGSAGGSFGTGGTGGSGASSGAGGSAGSFTLTGGRGGIAGSTNMGGSAGRGAGGMSGGSGTSSSSAGSGYGANGGVAPPADISGGSSGWASRYWDCCKPACGWTGNTGGRNPIKSCSQSDQTLSDNNAKNACESGGSAFMCWSDAPWAVGDKLAYGFAAASSGNYVCGRCYHIQFNGSSHNGSGTSTQALSGKHMIVQVINNGGVAADQFDLLIPGGGVGALNACNTQWGSSDLGAQYGGFLAGCNGDVNCVKQKCQTIFSGKQDLLDGCNWFLGWFAAADNPNFTFKQIACPADITNKSGISDPG